MIKLWVAKIKENHMLMMILCCGIPIVGIMVLSSLGLPGILGVLCPDSSLSFGTYLYDAGNDAF